MRSSLKCRPRSRTETGFNLAVVRRWKRPARRLVRSIEQAERELPRLRAREREAAQEGGDGA